MEFKKVWMSPETGKRSQYGYRTVGGILGIVLLMTLLLFGGTFLSLSMGIEQKGFSLLLLLAVSGLGIGLAIPHEPAFYSGCHHLFSHRR